MHVMSLLDTADYIGISRYTLAKYAREGRVPALKVGRRVLFDRDAIDRWLRHHELRPVGTVSTP